MNVVKQKVLITFRLAFCLRYTPRMRGTRESAGTIAANYGGHIQLGNTYPVAQK